MNLLDFLVPVPVVGDGTFKDTRRTFDQVQVLDLERLVLMKCSFFQLDSTVFNQGLASMCARSES